MSYALQADMTLRFGEAEVIELADRDNLGTIDATVLQGALDDASAEIDAYLSCRYVVPLTIVPRVFVTYCCDIARYRLSGAATTEVDPVRDRYKDAIRFLEAVRDGKIELSTNVAPAPANASQDLVFFTVPDNARAFSRGNR